MGNLLQAQGKQSRLCNTGTRLHEFAKWQGPFEVAQQVWDLNYEVVRTDRSGAHQIYHLNLLKKWREAESVMLDTAVSGEEDLGPEVNTKVTGN